MLDDAALRIGSIQVGRTSLSQSVSPMRSFRGIIMGPESGTPLMELTAMAASQRRCQLGGLFAWTIPPFDGNPCFVPEITVRGNG